MRASDPLDSTRQGTLAWNPEEHAHAAHDIRLETFASLAIRLVDAHGTALVDWEVQLIADAVLTQTTDDRGRVEFPTNGNQSTRLAVYGPSPGKPPALLVVSDLRPSSAEQVLVVERAGLAPSAILGVVTTPGWTAPPLMMLYLGDPTTSIEADLSLPSVSEPFALESLSPGRAWISVRALPYLVQAVGEFELPPGSFLDLGEIELPPPGQVRFADHTQGSIENRVVAFDLGLTTSFRYVTVAHSTQWLPGPMALLPGRYYLKVVTEDRVEHTAHFTVESAGSTIVEVGS